MRPLELLCVQGLEMECWQNLKPGIATQKRQDLHLHWRAQISIAKMVRKPGFAPGPSASQAEMLLLHHNPEMASAAGIAPATSTFAEWRSDLTELRG